MRTSLFRFLIAAALALPADPRHAVADPAGPAEVCRAAFTEDYTVKVDQTTAPAGAAADAPVRIHSYAFTSREGTISAGGKTYRRFRLRVQEYAGDAAAANALRRLAEETAGDLFVKSPLLAFAAGPALYRLDGACLFAPAEWRAIEEVLLGSFPASEGGPPGLRLRVACGGVVEESPLRAEKP